MNKQISSKTVSLVFGILVICFAIGFYVLAAWTEPTAPPPGGNVPAPLNTSSQSQVKIGGLMLNTGGFPNGLIVDKGNVGIGTTGPGAKLEVYPDADSAWRLGQHPSYTTYSALWTAVRGDGAGSYVLLANNANTFLNAYGAGNIYFREDNNNLMTILNNGNVGIGTTGPGAKLEVAGQVKITGGVPGLGKALISDASGLASWQTITGTLPSGTSGQTLRHDGTNWVTNSNLFNNGTNVGIGTTSPSQKLDVSGQIHATGDICTDQGGGVCLSTGGGGGGDSFADSVSKNIDTTYTAATSGILVVRAYIRARYEHNYVEIRSDDSATPTTVVGHIGAWCRDNCNTGIYHTMSVPILKGKNYRVVVQSISGAEHVIVDAIQFYPNK